MIKKKIRFMLVICMILYMVVSSFNFVHALSLSEMMSQTDDFINKGKAASSNINPDEAIGEFVDLGQILTMIGAGVMVAVTAYMGIKYLTAGPEAQAKLKVQLIGLVVAGMTIFGAYSIWKIVLNIAKDL